MKPGTLVKLRTGGKARAYVPAHNEGYLDILGRRSFWKALRVVEESGLMKGWEAYHFVANARVFVSPEELVMVLEDYTYNYILFSQEQTFFCNKDNFPSLFIEVAASTK